MNKNLIDILKDRDIYGVRLEIDKIEKVFLD